MGKIWNEFVAKAKAKGMHSEWDIAHAEGAEAAWKRDQAAAEAEFGNRSTAEYVESFLRGRAANGQKPHFESQDEMLAAMRDPAYKTNENYRKAVEAIVAQTPAEVIGVSGHAQDQYGRKINVGRDGLSEAATPQSMLKSAFRDAVLEKLRSFDTSTAQGRYDRLLFLTNPENAEIIREMEEAVTTPSQRTHQAMLDAKANGGEALRLQMGTEEDTGNDGVVHGQHPKDLIDDGQGGLRYRDGSSLPK